MGKSNKFDFTNRPNSGTKLGSSISQALVKEAHKVRKDADRAAARARKQSSDSNGVNGDGDANDLQAPHIIDLQAPSKALGDDGIALVVDGLAFALQCGTGSASLALEDLNISGNGVTAAALAKLAPVVELAKFDLKTMNLSGNNIKVATDEEATQWEAFLRSFEGCLKLRRIDLSNNPELGVRAMEILARVHVGEAPVTPVALGGNESVQSLTSQPENVDTDETHSMTDPNEVDVDRVDFGKSLTQACILARRCGLRSVPFITLHAIGLTDAGALWLSYILEDHHYPNQLMDNLNATHSSSSVKTYRQDSSLIGVDWEGNESTLSKEGVLLLQKTELIRRQTLFDDQSTSEDSITLDNIPDVEERIQDQRKSIERRSSRAVAGNRRASIRSIHTADGGEHEASELESIRRKIQRHIIEQDGYSTVELWRAAFNLFWCSRKLLYVAPHARIYYTGEPMFSLPDTAATPTSPPTEQQTSLAAENRKDGASKPSTNDGKAQARASSTRSSYAAKLTGSYNPTRRESKPIVTDVTNTPPKPKRIFKPQRKHGASDASDVFALTENLNDLLVRDEHPERFIRYQQDRIAHHASRGGLFRDLTGPGQLPAHLVDRVYDSVLTEREQTAIGPEQRQAVVAWAQDRATMETEQKWLKHADSYKVWMLLDSMSCLAYQP